MGRQRVKTACRVNSYSGDVIVCSCAIAGMLWVGGNWCYQRHNVRRRSGCICLFTRLWSLHPYDNFWSDGLRTATCVCYPERLSSRFRAESHIVAPVENPNTPDNLTPEVAFDNVWLRYPAPDLIKFSNKHLSLTAHEGKVLALKGPSGAGEKKPNSAFERSTGNVSTSQRKVMLVVWNRTSFESRTERAADGACSQMQQLALFSKHVAWH